MTGWREMTHWVLREVGCNSAVREIGPEHWREIEAAHKAAIAYKQANGILVVTKRKKGNTMHLARRRGGRPS